MIKKFRDSDMNSVEDFYRRVLNGDTTRKTQVFNWIQKNPNLNGEGPNYLLLFSRGKMVGYWGFMPVQFYCSGERAMLCFIQEALLDPSLRGQGLGRALLEDAHRQFDSFMCSVWHNRSILSILQKCRWVNLGAYRPLKRIFTIRGAIYTKWAKETGQKIPSLLNSIYRRHSQAGKETEGQYSIEIVQACGAEYDAFYWETAPKLGVISERTSVVLNWRYINIPHKKYTLLAARRNGVLCAYLVLRIDDQPRVRKGIIVDLLADPDQPGGLEALIDHSDKLFSLAGVDFSVCCIQKETFRQILSEHGYFACSGLPTDTLWIYKGRSVPGPLQATDLPTWYITYGDSDGDMW